MSLVEKPALNSLRPTDTVIAPNFNSILPKSGGMYKYVYQNNYIYTINSILYMCILHWRQQVIS